MVTSITKSTDTDFLPLIEKIGTTYKHGLAQGKLVYYWSNFIHQLGKGGEICVETLCRTEKQARRPDLAYISAELLEQYGTSFTILPQSFPLIAEVTSPDDQAEELFAKSQEYLDSGCLEVWLLFPETRLVLINRQKVDCASFLTFCPLPSCTSSLNISKNLTIFGKVDHN